MYLQDHVNSYISKAELLYSHCGLNSRDAKGILDSLCPVVLEDFAVGVPRWHQVKDIHSTLCMFALMLRNPYILCLGSVKMRCVDGTVWD